MGKRAFIDPTSKVLKSWGYAESNDPGDILVDVPEDFDLKVGLAKWDGANWNPFTPPPLPDRFATAKAKVAAVAGGPVRDALDEILKVL